MFNTNLEFLYITDIKWFKNVLAKIELPQWELNSDADPTLPIWHSLPVTDCHTLKKPCSIESRNNPSPKSEVEHKIKLH